MGGKFIAAAEQPPQCRSGSRLTPPPPWRPALTADQAVTDAVEARAGEAILAHGAGGVTGGLLVQLAADLGAGRSRPGRGQRLAGSARWAPRTSDYDQADWPERVRARPTPAPTWRGRGAGRGPDAARAVRDGGGPATITGTSPAASEPSP